MARINLIIADTDEAYNEGIVNFIMRNHSIKFQVSSFTRASSLQDYLSQVDEKVDILLISPELYSEQIPADKVRALILLTSGKRAETTGQDVINKYQHAEKIVSDITGIFAEKYEGQIHVAGGSKTTRVVGVYSPSGGTGKTCIALAASIQCAQNGLSTFYLNLEDLNSSTWFLKEDGEKSLSKALYYIKENNKNLTLKIEGTRCIEPLYNIHYFSPLESALEMEEILPDELETLIRQLRIMGQYDLIFLDMTNSFSSKNLKVLNSCDDIFLVFTQDMLAGAKVKGFMSELSIHSANECNKILDKSIFILNKYDMTLPTEFSALSDIGKAFEVMLPEDLRLKSIKEPNVLDDITIGFGRGIRDLIARFI